jgi:hypothetical protein
MPSGFRIDSDVAAVGWPADLSCCAPAFPAFALRPCPASLAKRLLASHRARRASTKKSQNAPVFVRFMVALRS